MTSAAKESCGWHTRSQLFRPMKGLCSFILWAKMHYPILGLSRRIMFKLSSSQGAHLFNCILGSADGPLLASCMAKMSVPCSAGPKRYLSIRAQCCSSCRGPFELGHIKLLVQPSAELASPVQVASALWRQQGLRSIASRSLRTVQSFSGSNTMT